MAYTNFNSYNRMVAMKTIIFIVSFLLFNVSLFIPSCISATWHGAPNGYIGGTSGKVDNLDVTTDSLIDGDVCEAFDSGYVCYLMYDDDNAGAESSPDIIAPDKDDGGAYSGDGRWVLQSTQTDDIDINGELIMSTNTNGYVLVADGDDYAVLGGIIID